MPVILTSVFSTIIIFITVYSMVKVLGIACKREEISVPKYRILVTSFVVIGILIATVLPFGYQRIFDAIQEITNRRAFTINKILCINGGTLV